LNISAQQLGKWGEKLAAEFLIKQGYLILAENFYTPYGELDLITEQVNQFNPDEKTVVFVEVKTKAHDGFGSPESWVDRRKQAQIGRVASGYLIQKDRTDDNCRFDVVAVTRERDGYEIRHIEDAFWLESDETGRIF